MDDGLKSILEAHGGSNAIEIENILVKEGILLASSFAVIDDSDIRDVFSADLAPMAVIIRGL